MTEIYNAIKMKNIISGKITVKASASWQFSNWQQDY